jgi:hypothetical protein
LSPSRRALRAGALASAFLDGDWSSAGLLRRGALVAGHARPSLRTLVRRVLRAYHHPPWDRPRELAAWIAANSAFDAVRIDEPGGPTRRWLPFQPAMGSMPWPVPPIPTLGELAVFLDLRAGELAWLADVRSLERQVEAEQLRNYRYRWIAKSEGGLRLLEAPKERLRRVQRHLLRTILDRIAPHEAAHGFVAGRSVLTFVRPHAGAPVVARIDLEDFFGSVSAGRVYGIFRCAGYPEAVAHTLTGLTTNVAPLAVWRDAPELPDAGGHESRHRLGRRLATPHLPQGAPTSPALANLCAHGLDRRLAGLAARFGLAYTRYADDLAFSGSPGRRVMARFLELVGQIALEEGFRVNVRKTQVLTQAARQRLAGLVVNRHPNLERRERDTLRAILHRAARDGLEGQNRSGQPHLADHLAGRVAWAAMVNPERAAPLRRLLNALTSEGGA